MDKRKIIFFLQDAAVVIAAFAFVVLSIMFGTHAYAAPIPRFYGPYPLCPHQWTQNLALGTTSPDVLALQRFLNLDPATQVAGAGVGSPGFETNYFGALTLQAVDRFQEKYAFDVLFPHEIYAPTGFFGPNTRALVNKICG